MKILNRQRDYSRIGIWKCHCGGDPILEEIDKGNCPPWMPGLGPCYSIHCPNKDCDNFATKIKQNWHDSIFGAVLYWNKREYREEK